MKFQKLNTIVASGISLCFLWNLPAAEASDFNYTEKTSVVHYNWGSGSPAANVPKDHFTALFDQSGHFAPGDYFIQTLADDGVKVEVDGNMLIDRWAASSGKIDRALWLNVNEGQHNVKTHYYEERGNAVLFSDVVPLDHWVAYYYPNIGMQGTPEAAKVISPSGSLKKLVDDHGLNSPAPGIPKDNFSARYTTAKRMPAGDYILRARADDGYRVYVDGKLVLDHWKANDGRTEDAIKVSVSDNAGAKAGERDIHWVEVHYYEGSGNSKIDLFLEPMNGMNDPNGWTGELYPNLALGGTPVILGGKNSANRISELDMNWGWNSPHYLIPSDKFSARFTREETFETGYYTFHAVSDDGVRVWVDDRIVIDSWKNSDGTLKQGKVLLEKGVHRIKVEYFDNTERANLKLNYFKTPNSSFEADAREVHFNWGGGSPDASVSKDQFTAVFNQSGSYAAGDYFVQTLADDGVKVEADGNWLINRWAPSGGTLNRALWLGVGEGEHTVKTHYYEDKGNALLFSDIVPLDSWLAYYYPNPNLEGTPAAAKQIHFDRLTEDHGLNSPAAGIPKDWFSAKYVTSKRLKAGEYVLRTRADDGYRVYVDGKLVMDSWKPNDFKSEDTIKLVIEDKAGVPAAERDIHWIEVEYYEGSGNSKIDFLIEPYSVAIDDAGWIGEIYPAMDFSGTPIILGGKNAAVKIPELNFNWGSGSPHKTIPINRFSAVFKRNIDITVPGKYMFDVTADDGVQLIIDGQIVIDSWHASSGETRSAVVNLSAGLHSVEVKYYENSGNALLKAEYKKVDDNFYFNKTTDVQFNWGSGSPAEDIPSDNFTALFDQSQRLEAGNYFVQTLADDGVKVEVNGQFLINRWADSDGKIDRALWLNATAGNHSVKTHYYDKSGNAALFSNIVPLNNWLAYYYPNQNLAGLPVASKKIQPVGNFGLSEDNGNGSPAPQVIGSDSFSAKYTTAATIAPGDYLLKTRADDGVRVYVDGELVLDRWTNSSVREDTVLLKVNQNQNVPAGQENVHWIEIDYFEASGASSIEFTLEPYNSNIYQGQWAGFIYPNKTLSGTPAVISGLGGTSHLKQDWKAGSPSPMIPADGFSAKFKYKGSFKAGPYILSGHFDDGAKVWVDGKLLIDEWYNTGQYGTKKTVKLNLTEGQHEITVDYFENIGNAYLDINLFEDNGFRVADRPAPYGPDFYEVKNGILYHYLGIPGSTTATIYIGPAPSFLTGGKVYVKDSADKFYLRTDVNDVYVGHYLPPYKGIDLRTGSMVSADRINNYIKGVVPDSPLIGYGQAFLNAQSKYGVNALYLVAHSLVESNWGRSRLAREKHNLFGFGAYDNCPFECAYYFPSFNESIEYVAWYVRKNYLNSDGKWYGGAPNLKGMNVRYATDMDWAEKISGLMHRMHGYNSTEYANASLLPANPDSPPTPGRDMPGEETLDVFPDGIQGATTSNVNFRTEPVVSDSTYIQTLSAHTSVVVLGQNNNGWYKVKVGDKIGWLHSDYVNVKNLLQVKNIESGSTLRIRNEPSTSAEVVGGVANGTYIKAVTDANGSYVKDSTNNWYQVHIPSTSLLGWVGGGSTYINEIGKK